MRTNSKFQLTFALALGALLTLGCQRKDYGADVEMSLRGEGVIIHAEQASCVDRTVFKLTGESSTSVSKSAVIFPNISITWKSKTKNLNVVSIKVSATGSNFSDYSKQIVGDEIDAIMGIAGATILGTQASAAIASGSIGYAVNSNDPTTRASLQYAPCGFAFGGLAVTDEDARTYADVTVELIGVATDVSEGTVENVRKKIRTRAAD